MGKYAFSKLNEVQDGDDQENVVKIGPFSHLTVGWMNNIVQLGNKRPLENDDLFATDDIPSSQEVVHKLEEQWNIECETSKSSGAKPQLWRAVMRMNSPIFYCGLVGWLFLMAFSLILPSFFLSLLLTHLQAEGKEEAWIPYLYLIGIIAPTLSMSLFQTVYQSKVIRLIMQIRTGLMGLVYRKVE